MVFIWHKRRIVTKQVEAYWPWKDNLAGWHVTIKMIGGHHYNHKYGVDQGGADLDIERLDVLFKDHTKEY